MTTTTGPRPLDHSRVDDEDVRADRRRRLFAAMDDHGLDVLVLGRPAEVAFATGARQLWTAGSRPFGPACVAVRATGRTHLLSTWDHDVPPEVGHDDLFGLSWNPATIAVSLAAIPGLREAARVGTTSSSPGFGRLVAAVAPGRRGRRRQRRGVGRPPAQEPGRGGPHRRRRRGWRRRPWRCSPRPCGPA